MEIVVFEFFDVVLPELVFVNWSPLKLTTEQFFNIFLKRCQNYQILLQNFPNFKQILLQICVLKICFYIELNRLKKIIINHYLYRTRAVINKILQRLEI